MSPLRYIPPPLPTLKVVDVTKRHKLEKDHKTRKLCNPTRALILLFFLHESEIKFKKEEGFSSHLTNAASYSVAKKLQNFYITKLTKQNPRP
jgi:hypothetical protein